jgi:hypothetical protein
MHDSWLFFHILSEGYTTHIFIFYFKVHTTPAYAHFFPFHVYQLLFVNFPSLFVPQIYMIMEFVLFLEHEST